MSYNCTVYGMWTLKLHAVLPEETQWLNKPLKGVHALLCATEHQWSLSVTSTTTTHNNNCFVPWLFNKGIFRSVKYLFTTPTQITKVWNTQCVCVLFFFCLPPTFKMSADITVNRELLQSIPVSWHAQQNIYKMNKMWRAHSHNFTTGKLHKLSLFCAF